MGCADDAAWMRRAVALAESVRTTTSPNPPVGCVLVAPDGTVVGEGATAPPGGPHAEAAALAAAGTAASGATAYTTLEPCNHTGRTGPCTEAIIAAGVTRVVCALADPNPVATGGAERLRAAGITVDTGCLADEATELLEVFAHGLTHDRPYVVAKWAQSLDGRIAAADGTSQWLTAPATRDHAHALRAAADAVLVGSGTVVADDPALTCRADGHAGPPKLRVVLDGRDRIPATAQVRDHQAPTLRLVAAHAARSHEAAAIRPTDAGGDAPGATGPGTGRPDPTQHLPTPPWRDVPATTDAAEAVTTDGGGRLDPVAVLERLAAWDVRSVLVEGGAAVVGTFLRAGLVDRLEVHIAPVIIGPEGRPAVDGPWPTTLGDVPRLRTRGVRLVGDDTLITAVPIDPGA